MRWIPQLEERLRTESEMERKTVSANREAVLRNKEAVYDALFGHIDGASQLCERVVCVLHNLVSI